MLCVLWQVPACAALKALKALKALDRYPSDR